METDKIVNLLHEKLQKYDPYGYDDDREEKVFAESDVLQALHDVFADIEQGFGKWNDISVKFPEIINEETNTEESVFVLGDSVKSELHYSKDVLIKMNGQIWGYGSLVKEITDGKLTGYGIRAAYTKELKNYGLTNTIEWIELEN